MIAHIETGYRAQKVPPKMAPMMRTVPTDEIYVARCAAERYSADLYYQHMFQSAEPVIM